MKKNLFRAFCLVLVLTFVLGVLPAMAAGDITVYVSVSDQGALALTKDGTPAAHLELKVPEGSTLADAIAAAHAAYCPDGAAGWELVPSDWGMSMTKIWGQTDGVGMFYVNGEMAMLDAASIPAADGDCVDLFTFSDLTYWSDCYSSFDLHGANAAMGEKITLTLRNAGYDENWNSVTAPLPGAVVKLADGTVLGTTDGDGKAVVSFSAPGTYVITASCEDLLISAPSCVVTVSADCKIYTVKAGDTLWSIAKATMGSGFRWGDLFNLNADLVKNPRRIYVGQTLRVPA